MSYTQSGQSKLKAVFILNRLPSYRRDVFRHLSSRCDVTVVASDPRSSNPFGEFDGDTRRLIVPELSLRNGRVQLFDPRRLRGSDVVVVTGSAVYLSTWAALFLCRVWKIPTVAWGHGWSKDNSRGTWFRRLFYGLATEMWVYTERQRERAISKGVNPAKVTVIGNAPNHVSPVGRKRNGHPTVGFIGRLVSNRRLDLLIEAASILNGRGAGIDLQIAGEGEEEESLRRLARTAKGSVEFLGAVYDDGAVAKTLASWDLLVVPSYAGLSILSGMSQGCPVVVSDDVHANGPEWDAVVPGFNGAHFRAGDSVDLSNAIGKLLASNELGSMSRNAVQTYTEGWLPESLAQRMVTRMLAVLQRADNGDTEL